MARRHLGLSIRCLLFSFILLFAIGLPLDPAALDYAIVRRDELPLSPVELLVPQRAAYAGAYIDFGEREDNVRRESILQFDELVGKQQAIVAFSSDWGNQNFPKAQLEVISSYGAMPLVYWSPWDRGLQEGPAEPGPNRFSLPQILAGRWDSYIDSWAEQARQFNRPMFVSWGLEMNGNWFPWGGVLVGANSPQSEKCEKCYLGPETFKACYRYVVDRVRRVGAKNILWVWHANNTSEPDEPWNHMANYYPGSDYADWLALSAYGQQYPTQQWVPVDYTLKFPFAEFTKIDPTKPLMLAEWGIGEFPKSGSKSAWLDEAFSRLRGEFSDFKAIVYWHERWQNGNQLYSNLRVNSSPASLKTYQKHIAHNHWLPRPIFRE